MMKGYLISIGEQKVSMLLLCVAPESYEHCWSNTTDRTIPTPYIARYFGHKIHLDQNEKLVMYGATHVIAIDGYSTKIVSYITSPVKNNLVICDR